MYELKDKELGTIVITPNPRAKRIIARRKSDHFQITVPHAFNMKHIQSVIDEMRPGLLKLNSPQNSTIDETTSFNTLTFKVAIKRTEKLTDKMQMSLAKGVLTIRVPQKLDLHRKSSQEIIKTMIIQALNHEAKRILIPKTVAFAKKLHLEVNNIKISKSISRWGSCSSRKSINLSLFLMLLPEKYIDYVILHELAHTIEMNHSPAFWKLLDSFCGEDSKAISNNVRKYKSLEKDILMHNH